MSDWLGGLFLGMVSLLPIALGLLTLRQFPNGEVKTLSRTSERIISRAKEPVAFWATMATGVTWLLLGVFILVLDLGGTFGLI